VWDMDSAKVPLEVPLESVLHTRAQGCPGCVGHSTTWVLRRRFVSDATNSELTLYTLLVVVNRTQVHTLSNCSPLPVAVFTELKLHGTLQQLPGCRVT
jgi:hypothetical protein